MAKSPLKDKSVALQVLCALTYSVYFASQTEARSLHSISLLAGLCDSNYNRKGWVSPIVLQSLWFLHSKASKPIWAVGGKLRLLYAKTATERAALVLGNRVQRAGRYPPWASRNIAYSLCI